jgi:hypothetical protein
MTRHPPSWLEHSGRSSFTQAISRQSSLPLRLRAESTLAVAMGNLVFHVYTNLHVPLHETFIHICIFSDYSPQHQ